MCSCNSKSYGPASNYSTMPQLLFPNAPFAKGIEVALICHVFIPGKYFDIGGQYRDLAMPAIAGAAYYGYNLVVHQMFGL